MISQQGHQCALMMAADWCWRLMVAAENSLAIGVSGCRARRQERKCGGGTRLGVGGTPPSPLPAWGGGGGGGCGMPAHRQELPVPGRWRHPAGLTWWHRHDHGVCMHQCGRLRWGQQGWARAGSSSCVPALAHAPAGGSSASTPPRGRASRQKGVCVGREGGAHQPCAAVAAAAAAATGPHAPSRLRCMLQTAWQPCPAGCLCCCTAGSADSGAGTQQPGPAGWSRACTQMHRPAEKEPASDVKEAIVGGFGVARGGCCLCMCACRASGRPWMLVRGSLGKRQCVKHHHPRGASWRAQVPANLRRCTSVFGIQ